MYMIKTAEHIYDKESGYITWLEVLAWATAQAGHNAGQGVPKPAPNIEE